MLSAQGREQTLLAFGIIVVEMQADALCELGFEVGVTNGNVEGIRHIGHGLQPGYGGRGGAGAVDGSDA